MSSFDDDVPASTGTDRAATTVLGGFAGCLRSRFRRQNISKNSNINATKAAPTTIPTMAAIESLLDFFSTGNCGGFTADVGDGAGEGKNGLHDGNGPPQSAKFPAKDEAGNFERVSGMDPLSLLFDTLNPVKLVAAAGILGREPENPLFSKKSPLKWVKLFTENGIGPEKLLDERSSRVSRVN
ncbi:hypothetical protein IC582_004046 [Cucumis melo]